MHLRAAGYFQLRWLMMRTISFHSSPLPDLLQALCVEMDNELKIFLQAFQELGNLFLALPISDSDVEELKDILAGIQQNAQDLALNDTITHALNSRATKWFQFKQPLKGIARIDIYDLRQANKVYGAGVVDMELHNLAHQLMFLFHLEQGDFFYRSPGSDEFKIYSVLKTPRELKALLAKPYADQELN